MCTSRKRIRFLVTGLLLLPLMVLAAGCSKEGTISGKVYYKGKVLQSGAVNIVPEGKGGTFGSTIGTDGSYSIAKVPPGPAKISVVSGSSKAPSSQEIQRGMGPGAASVAQKGMEKQKSMLKEKGKPADAGPIEEVNLPEKYGDPERSGLTVTITGGKQNHDIKME